MRTFLILLFIATSSFLNAQILKGHVQCEETGESVAYAHIYNVTTRNVIACDSSGYYKIKASIGDTILTSSVTHYWGKGVVDSTFILNFSVEQHTYTLDEVKIGKPISNEQFITQILTMDMPDTVPSYKTMFPQAVKVQPQGAAVIGGPITAIYNMFSKKAQNRIKAIELERTFYKLPVIYKKYNREIVADLTDLVDEDLDSFMAYCNFSDEYLYSATEYDIYETILRKFETFKIIYHLNKDTLDIDTTERS